MSSRCTGAFFRLTQKAHLRNLVIGFPTHTKRHSYSYPSLPNLSQKQSLPRNHQLRTVSIIGARLDERLLTVHWHYQLRFCSGFLVQGQYGTAFLIDTRHNLIINDKSVEYVRPYFQVDSHLHLRNLVIGFPPHTNLHV